MKRSLLALVALLPIAASAQTPTPAQMGTTPTTNPEILQTLDKTKTWVPIGAVDSTTHTFTPVGGGSSGGGQINVYATHAALLVGAATSAGLTIQQQGFYASGDGGEATYQWNAAAFCIAGTATPDPANPPLITDNLSCILPTGQSSSTPGRYLLNLTNGIINVKQFGMQPNGRDNSPYVDPLMTALSTNLHTWPGTAIVFPRDTVAGSTASYYYFSKPFIISHGGYLSCGHPNFPVQGPVFLLFAPGVDGLVQENLALSMDGGSGAGDINSCALMSMGGAIGNSSTGLATINNVVFNANNIPNTAAVPVAPSCLPYGGQCYFKPGDGVIAIDFHYPQQNRLAVNPGAYIQSADPVAKTATLASPYVMGPLNASGEEVALWDLPASQKYTVTTTIGSNLVTVLSGPRLLRPGDKIWSDAFPMGSTVIDVTNSLLGTPTVHTGGSGYVGTSGTMTWNGEGCVQWFGFNHAPVLNVTASGGVITSVTSVADAGACIRSTPTSGEAAWIPGGGLTGGSGASFNTTYQSASHIMELTMFNNVNASVTHTSGSPGQLWTIPTGIARRTNGGQTHDNSISYFGFGLDLICQSGSAPPTGCDFSRDEKNSYSNMLVGRMTRGNNVSASTSANNVYNYNSLADTVEAATLGSIYFNEGYNSGERGSTLNDLLVNCRTQNYSTFIGGYYDSAQVENSCMGVDANGNQAIGVPVGGIATTQIFIGGVNGSPLPNIGTTAAIRGQWTFQGTRNATVLSNAAVAAGGTTIPINTWQGIRVGLGVTDLTNPVIPSGTTITNFVYGGITLSNAITGGGVQINDQISISGQTACMMSNPGLDTHEPPGFLLDKTCAFSGGVQGLMFNGYEGAWDLIIPGGQIATDIVTTTPIPIASLLGCGGRPGFYMTVSNGQAIGTAGYGAAVGTTGSSTRPVFCDGSSWTYH